MGSIDVDLAAALGSIMDSGQMTGPVIMGPVNLPSPEDDGPLLGQILLTPTATDGRVGIFGPNAPEKPMWTTFDDVDGDGEEDEPITVTGERENELGNPPPPPGDPGPGWGGGGSGGPYQPIEDPLDCRDRAALDARTDIRAHSDDGRKEHGSVLYRGADGQVHRSAVFHGPQGVILQSDIEAAMTRDGIEMNRVIGFVHNHDAFHYGNSSEERALNRYPSGGVLEGGDWNAANWMVSNGAGGNGGNGFALYIIDPIGQMREFHYADQSNYANLQRNERIRGDDLPHEMESDGSTCG